MNTERLASHLKRFSESYEQALSSVENLLNTDPNLNKHNIFRIISSGKGRPQTHWSGKPEDKLKDS
jgi:hypothetical protein